MARERTGDPPPLLARVECRSEGQAEEKPLAVWFGGERHRIRRSPRDAVHGPTVAGEGVHRRVAVELDNGLRLELRRRLPDGAWLVTPIGEDTSREVPA